MPNNHKEKKKNDDKGTEEFLEDAESGCEACGGELKLEKVNLEDYQGGKLYMMESVPAYVCQECGEIWVPEPVMLEFEKMIETAKTAKAKSKKVKKGKVEQKP